MIKPASLWALMKSADAVTLGRVCAALGGQPVDLVPAEAALVAVVRLDSEWLDEAMEERRARDRDRKRRIPRNPEIPVEKTESAESTNSAPSFLPSFLPSCNKLRSVSVRAGSNGNGNGTEFINKLDAFKRAAAEDEGAFFAPEYDPVIIAAAVTGDGHSSRAFRKELARIGEAAFREEVYAMHRELGSGESVDNAGAALYKRLKSIKGETSND